MQRSSFKQDKKRALIERPSGGKPAVSVYVMENLIYAGWFREEQIS